MSVQRSTLPPVENDRFAPQNSLFNSLIGSRLKFDNLQLSEMSLREPEVANDESPHQGPPPSLIFSYNGRNNPSIFKDNYTEQRMISPVNDHQSTPFSFGKVFPNISDHIILEDFPLNDISEPPSPINAPHLTDPSGNPHATQGLFGTLLHSTSDVDGNQEHFGVNSIHESLVLPRFQRAPSHFHKLGSFLGPKSDNLKPISNDISTNPSLPNHKSRNNCLIPQNNENRLTFKSINEPPLCSCPATLDTQTRFPLSPSSPKNLTDNQAVKSQTVHVTSSSPSQPPNPPLPILSHSTPLPDTSPIHSPLRSFLIRFFTDTPFVPANCDFSPSESLILSSIFSRKYECEVPKQ